MVKTLKKALRSALEILIFLWGQHFVRSFLGIEPRIWFIVVYGITIAWLLITVWNFQDEILQLQEKIENLSLDDCMKTIKKVVNSIWYDIVSVIILLVAFGGVFYRAFFYKDFMARTNLYIAYLLMMAYVVIASILETIVAEKKSIRIAKGVTAVLWGCIFAINLSDFLR